VSKQDMLTMLHFKASRTGHINGRSNSKPRHKIIGSLEVRLHTFVTSALDGVEWPASLASRFAPGEIAQGTR
jgi:hypothetical protein